MNFNKYKILKPRLDISLEKTSSLIKIKKLQKKLPKCLGKDKNGLLLYHRGGGAKKIYRFLNQDKISSTYRILQIQYDPYRSSFINLCQFKNGSLFFELSESTSEKNIVIKNDNLESFTKGFRTELLYLPTKTLVYNVELIPNSKPIFARAAGSYCKIFSKTKTEVTLITPSNKKIVVSNYCKATIGMPSNIFKKLNKKYKAGNNRHLNKRPTVRGVAMNPVDHPHGGGEGKTSSGRPCVSPWGKLTKGVPTKKK